MSASARGRASTGFLSVGFRPFFLLSAAWAAAAIPLWLLVLAGRTDLPTAFQPVLWHAHEMVFGFGFATVAGFLLTAVPNWTGRMPLSGKPLGGLVLLWLLGRAAMLLPMLPAQVVAALDLLFPAAMMLAVAREIVAGRNWRNLPVLAGLSLLFLANLLVHLGAALDFAWAMSGIRFGIATLVALIALIGGRIIPSFTRNWLAKRSPDGAMPAPFGSFDLGVLVITVAALTLWAAWPGASVDHALLFVAGALNALRLRRWRGLAVRSEPLLIVLHVGYAWLAAGLLLLGAGDLVPQESALHALTVGAVGTMTLAVMARATLGHTGRALTSGPGCTAMFALVSLAALLRVSASLMSSQYGLLIDLSGVAWGGAYTLYVVLFARLLWSPRQADCVAP